MAEDKSSSGKVEPEVAKNTDAKKLSKVRQQIEQKQTIYDQLATKLTALNDLPRYFSEMQQVAQQMLPLTRNLEEAQEKLRANFVTEGLVDIVLGIFDSPDRQDWKLVQWLKSFKQQQDELKNQINQRKAIQENLDQMVKLKDPLEQKSTEVITSSVKIFSESINLFDEVFLSDAGSETAKWSVEMGSWNESMGKLTQQVQAIQTHQANYREIEVVKSSEIVDVTQATLKDQLVKLNAELKALRESEQEFSEDIREKAYQDQLAKYKLKGEQEDISPLMLALLDTASDQKERFFGDLAKSNPELVNLKNKTGITPLHVVIQQHRFDLAKLLWSNGADIEIESQEVKNKFLHLAAKAKDGELVKVLLDKEAQFEVQDKETGDHLLHLAAENDNDELVAFLLKEINSWWLSSNKAQTINAQNHEGNTALHLSVQSGSISVVNQLLAIESIEVDLPNRAGKTPLALAIDNRNIKLVRLLMGRGAQLGANMQEAYRSLAIRELEQQPFKTQPPAKVILPTIVARSTSKESAVPVAEKANESIGSLVDYYETSDFASVFNRTRRINTQQKLNLVADIKNKNAEGKNILHLAAERGDVNMIQFLLVEEYVTKNDLKLQKKDVGTLLHVAADKGHLSLVQYLVKDLQMDVNTINDRRKTALHVAAEQGRLGVVKFLISEGAKTNIKDQEDKTPLIRLNELEPAPAADNKAIKQRYKVLRKEAANNIDKIVVDGQGETLLHLAVATNDVHFVNKALAQQTNREKLKQMLECVNKAGNTALDVAIQQGNFEIAKVLVKKSMEVAASLKSSQVFSQLPLLFQNYLSGANLELSEEYLEIKDKQKTELFIAVEKGNVQYVENLFKTLDSQMADLPASAVSKKQLITRRIFELISLPSGKDDEGAIGQSQDKTLLDPLARWGLERQRAILRGEEETEEQAAQKQNYAKIARLLIQYVPRSMLPPQGLGFYDLLDGHLFESPELTAQRKQTTGDGLTKPFREFSKMLGESFEALKPVYDTLPNIIEVYKRSKDIFSKSSEFSRLDVESRENQQGKDAVLKMNKWSKSNRSMDVNFKDGEGNTLLHLAVQDNMEAVVAWLIPDGWQKRVSRFWEDMAGKVGAKADDFIAEKIGDIGGNILGGIAEKATGLVAGTAITIVTLPILGPFAPLAGIAAGKAAATAVEKITAVVSGAAFGSTENVEIIKPDGVDFNQQNAAGDTALHIAAQDDNKLWMVVMFLPLIKDINVRNNAGETPLHVAIRSGSKSVVAALLNAGAKLDIKNAFGETPLHLAVQKGDLRLFRMLLKYGADLNAQTNLKQTVSELIEAKHNLLVKELELAKQKQGKNEALISSLDEQRRQCFLMKNSLEQHIKHNQIFLVKKTENDAALEKTWNEAQKNANTRQAQSVTQDKLGNTLLHLAVPCGDTKLVSSVLAEKRIDIDRCNQAGETLLHIAARTGHVEMVQLLLKHNANIDIPNRYGKRPFEVASSQEVLNVFKESIGISSRSSSGFKVAEVEIDQSKVFPPPFVQEKKTVTPLSSPRLTQGGDQELPTRKSGREHN